mmetsp:Transcript_17685/g.40074  ORF Transcript_17685/g.40074 Transcript_17685/m.40074 type:complete len:207 (+) Transcript_17685:557-1177(+)
MKWDLARPFRPWPRLCSSTKWTPPRYGDPFSWSLLSHFCSSGPPKWPSGHPTSTPSSTTDPPTHAPTSYNKNSTGTPDPSDPNRRPPVSNDRASQNSTSSSPPTRWSSRTYTCSPKSPGRPSSSTRHIDSKIHSPASFESSTACPATGASCSPGHPSKILQRNYGRCSTLPTGTPSPPKKPFVKNSDSSNSHSRSRISTGCSSLFS